jgi:hypothetical protein
MARLIALLAMTLLVACGGGGGGGSGGNGAGSPPPVTTPVNLTNFTTITVDDGPAALSVGTDPFRDVDIPFVTVTICAPGSSTCQTIDHIQLDTGSVGLRIDQQALSAGMLSALPNQIGPNGDPVGECYGFVDGYTFGSVRTADFTIGGASVAGMPIDVIGDTGAFATAPSSCSSGGGNAIVTVKDLGSNGILGIGTTATDCGVACTRPGGFGAGTYYDCPPTGCTAIIARASNAVAPFQQLPNPIAAMSKDNNGSVIVMPAVSAQGAATTTGTLFFGIGTETNNGLGSVKPLTTDDGGFLTATYKGMSLPNSFIDSGSSAYFFTDSTLTACTDPDSKGFYCPATPLALSPALAGLNGTMLNAGFTLYNAETAFASGNAALAGIGADPNDLSNLTPISNSFDFGFPFFYGRSVYTAISGRKAGNVTGPFVGF